MRGVQQHAATARLIADLPASVGIVGASLLAKGLEHPPNCQRLKCRLREQAHSHKGCVCCEKARCQKTPQMYLPTACRWERACSRRGWCIQPIVSGWNAVFVSKLTPTSPANRPRYQIDGDSVGASLLAKASWRSAEEVAGYPGLFAPMRPRPSSHPQWILDRAEAGIRPEPADSSTSGTPPATPRGSGRVRAL